MPRGIPEPTQEHIDSVVNSIDIDALLRDVATRRQREYEASLVRAAQLWSGTPWEANPMPDRTPLPDDNDLDAVPEGWTPNRIDPWEDVRPSEQFDPDIAPFPVGNETEPEELQPFYAAVAEVPYQGIYTRHIERPSFEEQFMGQGRQESQSRVTRRSALRIANPFRGGFIPFTMDQMINVSDARDFFDRNYTNLLNCTHSEFNLIEGIRYGNPSDSARQYGFTITCDSCHLMYSFSTRDARPAPQVVPQGLGVSEYGNITMGSGNDGSSMTYTTIAATPPAPYTFAVSGQF